MDELICVLQSKVVIKTKEIPKNLNPFDFLICKLIIGIEDCS
jgi:hypothetical protein